MEDLVPIYGQSNGKRLPSSTNLEPDAKRLRISATNVEPDVPNLRISVFPEKPPVYARDKIVDLDEIIPHNDLPPHVLDRDGYPIDDMGNRLFYCDDNDASIPVRVKRAARQLGRNCAHIKKHKGTDIFTIAKIDDSEIVFQGGRKTRKHKKSYNKKATTRKQRRTLKKKRSLCKGKKTCTKRN